MRGWTSGNELELLENGETFFPEVCAAIDAARREILLETFIWFEDEAGRGLADALVRAAERGVRVTATVDGYGSPSFSHEFLKRLSDSGVSIYSFDPQPTLLRIRTNVFCRLHRKIVVIDGKVAFIGGMNICDEHLRTFGSRSKQDYAVKIEGPVVEDIHRVARHGTTRREASRWRRWRYWLRRVPRDLKHAQDSAQALFVTRDNDQHSTDIETMYRIGMRNAKRHVTIATAYFFPGYRFLRDLARAARRGVDVRLILQGKPDLPLPAAAASILYNFLLTAGVKIYHYKERPLHAKVAVIDGRWATVGSSNLDPTSLGLNLEANLFVLDERFAGTLNQSLQHLIEHSCEEVGTVGGSRGLMGRLLLTILYHLTRRMPRWGQLVLRRPQHIEAIGPNGGPDGDPRHSRRRSAHD